MRKILALLVISMIFVGCSTSNTKTETSVSKTSSRQIYLAGVNEEQKGNYAKAVVYYSKAAKLGNWLAQNDLGTMYYYGKGVKKDNRKALELYTKSERFIHGGLPQFNIAQIYWYGRGVKKDKTKALKWYLKSATEGDFARAQFNLGVIYDEGLGVKKNYKKAMNWYNKATIHNHAGAWNNLGSMAEKGQGMSVNNDLAFDLFLKAANLGDLNAQYNIGNIYLQKKNYSKAKYWFQKSAKQGKKKAIEKLATL